VQKKLVFSFFSIILIICLIAGLQNNLGHHLGVLVGLLAAAILGSLLVLRGPINRLSKQQLKWLLGVGLVVMFLGQLFVLTTLPMTVFHDPYRVLAQADQMAHGDVSWNITYFWRYSNNVAIAYILSIWLNLTSLFHLTTNTALSILSLAVLDGFIIYTLHVVNQHAKDNLTSVGVLGFFALTPFAYTYYAQVIYSDLPSMFVLLVVLQIFWRWSDLSRRQRQVAGVVLTLAMLIGFLLKPNIIVVVPALLIIAAIMGSKHVFKASHWLVPMLLVVLGIGLSVPVSRGIQSVSHYTPRTGFAFPATHWTVMGLNRGTDGMYSAKDVTAAVELPNAGIRTQQDLKLIGQRVSHLGPVGLVQLWWKKLGVFLDVHDILYWYNGGYRAAPAWYQTRTQTFARLSMLAYTAATLVLWVMVAIRLLFWRPDWRSPRDATVMLAVVVSLGYLAFHTLLWEVESRYGQIIVPMLIFIAASIPRPELTQPVKIPRWLSVTVPVLTVVLAFGGSWLLGRQYPLSTVVAAQRSQLSVQYHAAPTTIGPGTVITEDIDVNAPANYVSVQIHDQSRVNVTLMHTQTKQEFKLRQTGDVYWRDAPLAPGRYRIHIQNQSAHNQAVDIVRTHNYRLANHPLILNGHKNPNASLVYTVLNRYQKQPLPQ